jgi:S-disulfanyl-L-cysteine oxidoreductase SoxD
MSTPDRRMLVALLLACCSATAVAAAASAAEGPGLGVPVPPARIAPVDISIPPDGSGLPAGKGNALDGEPLFAAKCAMCHGERGQDGQHDRLVGGLGTLATDKPVKTIGSYWPFATTVFDYIRRAMPYYEPRSLSDNEAYSLTAYLLYLNGVIGQRDEMNATSLPRVKMPNRDNFIWTADVPVRR